MYTTTIKFNIPKILEYILNDLQELGARPILVGGCVRDYFLNIPVKDYDVEIFGIDCFDTIENSLKKFGSVKLVGKSFGVLTLRVDNYDFDFALPRREKKVGNSHQDFEIITNANLSFKEAAMRRDFTINAIGYDFINKEFLDPFNGLSDLKARVIKHIDDNTFIEDSLRVYRAVGFASRFNFKLEEKIDDEYKKLYLFYSVLCHDLGKPFCTQEINGKITSYKHEVLGIEPTISFLSKLTNEKKFIDIVCSLVKSHLAPFQLYLAESSLKAIKRLSLKVNIEDLCLVCLADCLGRDIPDKDKCYAATIWLLEKAKELEIHNEPIKALVQGRDLIALGFNPSQKFKEILDFAFDLQLDEHLGKENIIKEILKKY